MRTHTFTHRGESFTFAITHPADLIQNHHSNGWFYEREELELMETYVPQGGLFLDVGANVGNHSVWMGRFRGARCVCVEPNPEVQATLNANIEMNKVDGGVIFVGLGQSLSIGHGLKTVHPGNLGGTRFEGAGPHVLITGDSLGLAPHLIKIDVEGMELDVLAGLEATISAARPALFIEVSNNHARELGHWAAARDYKLHSRHRRYAANENYLLLP